MIIQNSLKENKIPLNIEHAYNKNRVYLKPLITYDNSLLNKFNALGDNIGKSGIYRWVHRENNTSYVGSSKDLHIRFKDYYNINFLKRRLLTRKSLIYKALLDEGYGAFNLEILEYCDKQILIKREQYYIDLLAPKYNIQTIAGSVLRVGHTTTVINKKDGSTKVYDSMRAAAKGVGVKYSTLVNYVNKDKLLKGIYLITKIKPCYIINTIIV